MDFMIILFSCFFGNLIPKVIFLRIDVNKLRNEVDSLKDDIRFLKYDNQYLKDKIDKIERNDS